MTHQSLALSVSFALLVCGGMRAHTHDDFRATVRLARDGDLQADWNKLLDARERFVTFTGDEELAPLAHYYVGYTDWRLSSLAFIAVGAAGSSSLVERAITSLEAAIAKRPAFPDAHALLATNLGVLAAADASKRDGLLPRLRSAWQRVPADEGNPRVMMLRAMSLVFAPPPYGDREKGFALWRRAIDAFAADRPGPLMPDWGDAESVAWLGGVHLMQGRHAEAADLLERAVRLRPDFWWAGKAALPVARRPW